MMRPTDGAEAGAVAAWAFLRSELPVRPARAILVGALGRAVIAGVAGAILLHFGARLGALVAWGTGAALLAAALASPHGVYAAIERRTAELARFTGRITMVLVMVPTFFLVFVPFGLLFRRGARDPLARRFERELVSYWKRRGPPAAPERLF